MAAEAVDKPSLLARFTSWRRGRPFFPGLMLIFSGIIIIVPAYVTFQISELLVMISTISGVSTLLLGSLLIMFGLGAWLQPHASTYLGVLSIIVAVVALPTSNFGGFIVGSILGIIGGAFTLGWEKTNPSAAATVAALILGGSTMTALSLSDPQPAWAQESSTALSTVTADDITLSGNVRASLDMTSTGQRTLVLHADQLLGDNLAISLPGRAQDGLLSTAPGANTQVTGGPVEVVATGLEVTPVIDGAPTTPVPVDLTGGIGDVLEQLGIPQEHPVPEIPIPEILLDHLSLADATIDLVSLHCQDLDVPVVSITADA